MKRQQIAGAGMIGIFSLTIIFHLLVITGIIPYAVVWGGRLQTKQAMYYFEAVSILLNVFLLLVVMTKVGLLRMPVPVKVVNALLWTMSLLFFINTIGNLLSVNYWERVVFTPVTLLLFVFAALLAKKQKIQRR